MSLFKFFNKKPYKPIIKNFSEKELNDWVSDFDRNSYYLGKNIYESSFGKIVGLDYSTINDNFKTKWKFHLNNETYQFGNDSGDIEEEFQIIKRLIRIGSNQKAWDYFTKAVRSEDGDWHGIPDSIITDKEMEEYFYKYFSYHLYNNDPEMGNQFKVAEKLIIDYCRSLKQSHYDKSNKEWSDFDITHAFLRVRSFMINPRKVIDNYVWILNDTFIRIYRPCRDYAYWKSQFLSAKKLFENIKNWECGNIFRVNEDLSKFEKPLLINWNIVGKDFLKLKTKLKKEDKGGYDWLKKDVKKHIYPKFRHCRQKRE